MTHSILTEASEIVFPSAIEAVWAHVFKGLHVIGNTDHLGSGHRSILYEVNLWQHNTSASGDNCFHYEL